MFARPRFFLSLIALVSLFILPVLGGAQDKTGKEAEPKSDDRLACIGSLAHAHIYTTYGYVGTVADAFAHDIYKAEKVQELMKEVAGLADMSMKQLKAIRSGNLVDSDKKAIDELVEVYGILKEEAQALSAYTKSKDEEDLQKFEKARTSAWTKIKTVLRIKDQ
jgi:hypothetical protein